MARTKKDANLRTAAIVRAQNRAKNAKKSVLKKLHQTRKSAKKEKDFHCDSCTKSFSQLSNLNQHKKNKHGDGENGLRVYVCPHCGKEQSTKFAHIRHFERKHPNESVENVNENARMKSVDNSVKMSDEAKTALIERLQKENSSLKEENEDLKKQIHVLQNQLTDEAKPKKKSKQAQLKQPQIKQAMPKQLKLAKVIEAPDNQSTGEPESKRKLKQAQLERPHIKQMKPKQRKLEKIIEEPDNESTGEPGSTGKSKQAKAIAKQPKPKQEKVSEARSVRQRTQKRDDSYIY